MNFWNAWCPQVARRVHKMTTLFRQIRTWQGCQKQIGTWSQHWICPLFLQSLVPIKSEKLIWTICIPIRMSLIRSFHMQTRSKPDYTVINYAKYSSFYCYLSEKDCKIHFKIFNTMFKILWPGRCCTFVEAKPKEAIDNKGSIESCTCIRAYLFSRLLGWNVGDDMWGWRFNLFSSVKGQNDTLLGWIEVEEIKKKMLYPDQKLRGCFSTKCRSLHNGTFFAADY